MKNKIINFISSNRNNGIISFLKKSASNFVKAYNNVSYNSLTNGEMKAFTIVNKYGCDLFVDCGANDGMDPLYYMGISQNKMDLMAFEVIPAIYDQLVKNTSHNKKITAINLGLGCKNEVKKLKYYPKHTYLSSAYRADSDLLTAEVIDCKIVTGDSYFSENNIPKIDFLKIDAEGMDFEVIKGFEGMIKEEKIKVIQFEYTNNFIYADCFLKTVYDFFRDKNYSIGKIYPNGVDFIDYDVDMEDFLSANFIIVNKNQTQLIQDLKSY